MSIESFYCCSCYYKACQQGHVHCLEALRQHDVPFDHNKQMILHLLFEKNDLQVLQWLHRHTYVSTKELLDLVFGEEMISTRSESFLWNHLRTLDWLLSLSDAYIVEDYMIRTIFRGFHYLFQYLTNRIQGTLSEFVSTMYYISPVSIYYSSDRDNCKTKLEYYDQLRQDVLPVISEVSDIPVDVVTHILSEYITV